MQQNRKLRVRTLPVMIAAAFAGGAFAAETLEEVIVTAQKRAERLQDVPISMSAISGSQLENRGVQGAANLDGLVPNVQLKASPGQSLVGTIAIRGIVSGQPAIWADPSTGIYVDGVFVGKNQGALFDLVDLERVEVLRGPQGTLFGRNTEAGAISLVTRKPSGTFSGQVGFEIGNYGHHVEKLSMDLPRTGIMSLSFAVRNEKRNGWMDNPTGNDWGSKGRTSGRLAAAFEITPKFRLDYAYDHARIDETPIPSSLYSSQGYGALYPTIPASPTNPNPFSVGNLFAKGFNGVPQPFFVGPLAGLAPLRAANMLTSVQADIAPYANTSYPSSVAGTSGHRYFQKLNVDGQSLTATYELNEHNTLKYIGAYRKMKLNDNKDLDGTPVWLYESSLDTHYDTYSHEFQWIGNTERLNYVLGYYHFKDDGQTFNNSSGSFLSMLPASLAPLFGGIGNVVGYNQVWERVTTSAKALYGQFDYKVTDALTGTVGIRHTKEEKSGAFWRTDTCSVNGNPLQLVPPGGMCPTKPVTYKTETNGFVYSPQENTTSFSSTTPLFALSYKVNDGLNVYGRAAKGFKSGGFPVEANYVVDAKGNVLSDPRKPYSDERSTAFELGFKSNFWQGKGQLNAAVFQTNVKDFQISVLPPGVLSPTLVNAGEARYQGLELEGMVAVAPGWRVQFGYGYLHSKFKELMNYNYAGDLVNAAGNTQMSNAPRHTLNLTVDGRLAKTNWGVLRGIVDMNYTSKYYFYYSQRNPNSLTGAVGNTDDFSTVSAMTKVNARLLLAEIPIGGPGAADLSLWVRNLTDVNKKISGIDFGGLYQIANWTEPRMYGMSFNYKW